MAHTTHSSLPSIEERSVTNAKRFKFCRNGDKNFGPKMVTYNDKKVKNFEKFLEQLTTDVKLRSGGSVYRVYTPRQGTRVTNLQHFQEGECYVVAGKEKFLPMGYTAIEGHSPRPSKINKTNFNSRIEPVFHSKIRQDARFRQSQAFASRAKRITVAVNNDDIDHSHVVLIPANKTNNLQSILETVDYDLNVKKGVNHRVEYLVDNDSEVICSNPDDIIEDHIYVACNSSRKFQAKSYSKDGRKNFVVIPSPRPLQSYVNGSRENKRPRTLPPIGSKNYKGSPDNSVTSNPEYRRKPNQANGAIHTKPQKHKRTPEKKPKQTDYDRDDGGVFKAKETNRHSKGAKEVGETKDTRTDLPIDQVPAEEVKDEKIKSQRTPKETTQKTNSKTNNNNKTNQKTADHSHGSKDPAPQKHSGTRGEFNNVSPLPNIGHTNNRSSTPVGRNGQNSPTQKELDLAATKIQANYRGHKTRQELTKEKEKTNKKDALSNSPPAKVDDKKVPNQQMKEDEAATKIQAGFRGHKTREELKKEKEKQQDDKANAQQDQKQPNAPPAQSNTPAPAQSDKTAPKGDQTAPKGDQTAPKGDQNAPKGDQTAPKGDQNAPKGDQNAPKGDQTAPKDNQTGPKGDQNAPKGDQNAPKGDQNVPKGDNTAKKTETESSADKGDKPPVIADSSKAPPPAGQMDQSVPQGGNTGPTTGRDQAQTK